MLTRIGAARIGGAAPDRASEPTSLPVRDSGGAERGILTAGTRDGIPTGTQIPGVTGANGIAANAPHATAHAKHLGAESAWC